MGILYVADHRKLLQLEFSLLFFSVKAHLRDEIIDKKKRSLMVLLVVVAVESRGGRAAVQAE